MPTIRSSWPPSVTTRLSRTNLRCSVAAASGGRTTGVGDGADQRSHGIATQNWDVHGAASVGIGPDSASVMPAARYQATVS